MFESRSTSHPSAQSPLQSALFGGHVNPQIPLRQTATAFGLVGQACSQAPQLFGSFATSTHERWFRSPQAVSPGAQTHSGGASLSARQYCPGSHLFPHTLQLFESSYKLASQPSTESQPNFMLSLQS